MKASIRQKLDHLSQRFEEITALLAEPDTQNDQDRFRALSREYAQLNPVVTAYRGYLETLEAAAFAESLAGDPDADVRAMAKDELADAEAKQAKLEEDLQILLLPRDPTLLT